MVKSYLNPVFLQTPGNDLQSKYIKRALVNSKFQFDVESFDLKFELNLEIQMKVPSFL